MHKEDLALNNLQWLICHQNKSKTYPEHLFSSGTAGFYPSAVDTVLVFKLCLIWVLLYTSCCALWLSRNDSYVIKCKALHIDLWQAKLCGFQKQNVKLCLKVNKGLWKCYMNCMGRNAWMSEKYIMMEIFNSSVQSEREQSVEWRSHTLWVLA